MNLQRNELLDRLPYCRRCLWIKIVISFWKCIIFFDIYIKLNKDPVYHLSCQTHISAAKAALQVASLHLSQAWLGMELGNPPRCGPPRWGLYLWWIFAGQPAVTHGSQPSTQTPRLLHRTLRSGLRVAKMQSSFFCCCLTRVVVVHMCLLSVQRSLVWSKANNKAKDQFL